MCLINICPEAPDLVKVGQNYRELCMEASGVKCYQAVRVAEEEV